MRPWRLNPSQPLRSDVAGGNPPYLAELVQHLEEIPGREPRYAVPEAPVHPRLQQQLLDSGIPQLFIHQALAYDAAMSGHDVVVVTGTGSGKTLCYNLPALQFSITEPAVRCLYLFPTKALAQDQLGKLQVLGEPIGVRPGVYDGDTPTSQRSLIRRTCPILLSNPDMLHVGILPNHENWARFLKSLKLIVLDELHAYRGVFGSHVANLIRRLIRLCEWHRSRPQIIGCSGTIGNPLELFSNLTGRQGVLVDEDGGARGKRTFCFFNPPELATGGRFSSNATAADLLSMLVRQNIKSLVFSRARVSAELVLRYARKRLESDGFEPTKVESYRAGYTAKERRTIEQSLFKGTLVGLSATSAMELGVDVGGLDAVILNGYPGTAASFWQQAGRAGRGARDGLAFFVAHDDPLEQFLVREPRRLLESRVESVTVNPSNATILEQHLLCAAHERPIAPHELEAFGDHALTVAHNLEDAGRLEYQRGTFFYPGVTPPAIAVNLRGASNRLVRLMVDGTEIGTMEYERALFQAHPGAVYLHRGQSFLVTELDLEANVAILDSRQVSYYTQPMLQSVIEVDVEVETSVIGAGSMTLAGVTVTDMVLGFRRRPFDGGEPMDTEELNLPSITYPSIATLLRLPAIRMGEDIAAAAREVGGVHGVEHALIAVAPLLAGCERGDLGSAWYVVHPHTLCPTVFTFDKARGGVGLSESLYKRRAEWIPMALSLLSSCHCKDGCPGCVLSPRCEVSNDTLHKIATVEQLAALS